MRNIILTSILIAFVAISAQADEPIKRKLSNGKTITYYNCGREAAMETSFVNTYGDVNVCTRTPQSLADRGIIPEDYFVKFARDQREKKEREIAEQQARAAAEGPRIDCNSEDAILGYMNSHGGNFPRYCNGLQYWTPKHNAAIKYSGQTIAPVTNFVPQQ